MTSRVPGRHHPRYPRVPLGLLPSAPTGGIDLSTETSEPDGMNAQTDADLLAAYREAAAALADAIARRDAERRDEAHAAFHGRPLRYGRVEARGGAYARRGRTVCLDCYRGREWDGRYDRLEP